MYEIWYIPRIQDELVVAQFKTEDDAQQAMSELKDKRPLFCLKTQDCIYNTSQCLAIMPSLIYTQKSLQIVLRKKIRC